MAFAVPVIKKDFDIYALRRRSVPATSSNKMTGKNYPRRRVISATCSSIRRPTVNESNDSVLSQSVDRRHVHFGVCHEYHYRSQLDDDDDEVEEEEEYAIEEDLAARADGDNDCDLGGSVDSGRSSLDSAEDSDSKESISEAPPRERAQEPPRMPTSILRRSSADISQSATSQTTAQRRPKTVRNVLQFLVAKCAPRKN